MIYPKTRSGFEPLQNCPLCAKLPYKNIYKEFKICHNLCKEFLLCVYNQDSKPQTDLFFKFLDYIYHNQPPKKENWATLETMQKYAAKASPEINQDALKNCIEKESYRGQVEKNTAYGDKLMGHLYTPSFFVDGAEVKISDDATEYESLKNAIQQALEKAKSK